MNSRPEPFNNLGMVLEAVEHLDEAIENYRAACELDATSPEYLGNLARALIKRNDRDPEAKEVLQDLLMYESRPEWKGWAREKLATGKFSIASAEPEKEPEAVPTPPADHVHPQKLAFPNDQVELPAPAEE